MSNFLCRATIQSDPNVSSIPSLFLKAILHWMMSIFPPNPGLSQPNSEENFEQRFSRYFFAFHLVLLIKEQFYHRLSLLKFPTGFKNIRILKSFTLSVQPTFGTKYPIGTIRISIQIFFYPLSYGIDIRFTSTLCKRKAHWIKIYSTVYLSDSHPLGVNLAGKNQDNKFVQKLLFILQLSKHIETIPGIDSLA